MPGDLRALITASFGGEAAEAWSKFTVGEADKLVLHEAALKVLKMFPGRKPGACALMSAVYSLALEKLGTQSGYVVAGSLYIGEKRIFGEDGEFDAKPNRRAHYIDPQFGQRRPAHLVVLPHRLVVELRYRQNHFRRLCDKKSGVSCPHVVLVLPPILRRILIYLVYFIALRSPLLCLFQSRGISAFDAIPETRQLP